MFRRFATWAQRRIQGPRRSRFGKDAALERAAEELAERSRLGEQNAMAQLVVLGESYRRGTGGRRVKESYEAVERYLHEHPTTVDELPSGISLPSMLMAPPAPPALSEAAEIPPEAQVALQAVMGFGCDVTGVRALASLPGLGGIPGTTCAIVILADRGPITPRDFTMAGEAFDEEGRASFVAAADDPNAEPRDEAGYAGFVLGRAARLQAIRRGGHFALLSPTMAWELGQ